jgi:hypothetical protein
MGERVSVRDEPPLASEAPRAVPLGYGREDVWRGMRPRLHALYDTLGGWRQIGFAFGVGFILGGIGDALAVSHNGDAPAMLFFGGLLIGLTLRVPWLKG